MKKVYNQLKQQKEEPIPRIDLTSPQNKEEELKIFWTMRGIEWTWTWTMQRIGCTSVKNYIKEEELTSSPGWLTKKLIKPVFDDKIDDCFRNHFLWIPEDPIPTDRRWQKWRSIKFWRSFQKMVRNRSIFSELQFNNLVFWTLKENVLLMVQIFDEFISIKICPQH